MFHKELQKWFGSVLRTPLDQQKISPLHHQKASEYIQGTKEMKPHERLEIYNQQYWWRLFNALQHIFPSLTKWVGITAFNQQMAEPYFLAHNPGVWSLYLVGEEFLFWLGKQSFDPLLMRLAHLDKLFYDTFLADVNRSSSLDPLKPFVLQPHVRIVNLEDDLILFRKELLENKNPKKPGPSPVKAALYRVPLSGKTFWQPLSDKEFLLLKSFEKGTSLEEALAPFEDDASFDIAGTFSLFTSLRLIQNAAS